MNKIRDLSIWAIMTIISLIITAFITTVIFIPYAYHQSRWNEFETKISDGIGTIYLVHEEGKEYIDNPSLSITSNKIIIKFTINTNTWKSIHNLRLKFFSNNTFFIKFNGYEQCSQQLIFFRVSNCNDDDGIRASYTFKYSLSTNEIANYLDIEIPV